MMEVFTKKGRDNGKIAVRVCLNKDGKDIKVTEHKGHLQREQQYTGEQIKQYNIGKG